MSEEGPVLLVYGLAFLGAMLDQHLSILQQPYLTLPRFHALRQLSPSSQMLLNSSHLCYKFILNKLSFYYVML